MSITRRNFMHKAVAGSSLLLGGVGSLKASDSLAAGAPAAGESVSPQGAAPDPLYEKPAPITVAELAKRETAGVSAYEVNDYAPGLYKGPLEPSPPHADLNPRKAIIVIWKDGSHRFVFSHEASYCPWMELPNGVGLCNQFFEGNNGWAELFNQNGRKEHNSSVDIIESGPEQVWVRWNYCCVNLWDDSNPALRGTEDYVALPNGHVWRRLTYETLMPDNPDGYSWQPIDFFALAPSGTTWKDLFPQDPQHGDYHVGSVIAAYRNLQYDVYWSDEGKPRRRGNAELLLEISHSPGFAMVMPFKAGYLFAVLGGAGGFPPEKSQVVDHSFTDTGGWGWGAARWDHWPVGWLNSQTHFYKPGSPYPYSFGPFSHYIVDEPLKDVKHDYAIEARDMKLNRWSERHVYYTLTGMSHDLESIRNLARTWLDQGNDCAKPKSVAILA
ncbi:MAG: hypothetical protein M1404_03300 [Acidobacteria bacterium]|nr:hypothetical protein [Acidobacteriota bacterium]